MRGIAWALGDANETTPSAYFWGVRWGWLPMLCPLMLRAVESTVQQQDSRICCCWPQTRCRYHVAWTFKRPLGYESRGWDGKCSVKKNEAGDSVLVLLGQIAVAILGHKRWATTVTLSGLFPPPTYCLQVVAEAAILRCIRPPR